MRSILALVLIVVAAAACAQEVSRAEMARRLANVKVGMTEAEAMEICGPGEVQTFKDSPDYRAIKYGVVGETWKDRETSIALSPDLATLGCIHVQKGRVTYICGGEGKVIDPSVLPERELRVRLTEIGDLAYLVIVGRPTSVEWLPAAVRLANALRPLGKDRIIAVLKEYVRVRYGNGPINEFDGLSVLIRLLQQESVTIPDGILGPELPRPDVPELLPHYPVIRIEGLPTFAPLYLGFRQGYFTSFNDLRLFEERGKVVAQSIRGPKNPFTSLLKAAKGPAWPTPSWWQKGEPVHVFSEDYKHFRDALLMQVLSYCEGLGGKLIETESQDAWTTTVEHYEGIFNESGYAWDANKCNYVISSRWGHPPTRNQPLVRLPSGTG